MKLGELTNGVDTEKESELYRFLRKCPESEEATIDSVRHVIDEGNGPFSKVELLFLFLESLVKRVKGENLEW